MIRIILFVSVLIAGTSIAGATPYWIAWEGDEFPENQGWERHYGNWDGPEQGEADRTLENGVLTYDSLHDEGVYDYSEIDMAGQLDPDPGELFVMEWRLKVDQVTGWYSDHGIAMAVDAQRIVGFEFEEDEVVSSFVSSDRAPIEPGIFHAYRFLSWDMLDYELYIDDELAIEGSFRDTFTDPYVAWGDSVKGAASVAHWDYFRFGIIPEPASMALILFISACCVCRRFPCSHSCLRKDGISCQD